MPLNGYDQGMLDCLTLNADGEVEVPQKPGLGLEVDWERMEAMTTARY
jgi:L-alanine-DL-glutamate epimerase-like enolase superfamily enzyme